MAIPITQAYGVTLPIMHGPRGYFAQSYTIIDQIKSNLTLLLRTKKGERRMNPEFGSGLWSVLFDNYTDDLNQIIESTIRSDVSKWMNYVIIQSISIKSDQVDFNKLNVPITFTVPSVGVTSPQTLDVQINTNTV